ncbi:Early nodulin-like protein 1 [Hibiscus syriacus]|uniref:Early nodulin-like protein 1 n=1 Tax=Hibiscus syriacus TaxID=106335 RepID=A0A6A2Y863_HIBSY|nr:Early nodulin-like protein 1 [Hibiscus syriacus]
MAVERDGWVVTPSESYNHWSERMRFQVNDTLFFKYKKGSDSVLLVTKENYFSCNTKNPIQSLAEGDSIFKFDRSGHFFFITGNADNCNKGQKLTVVVMAVRHKPPQQQPPSASPSPSSAEGPADSVEGVPAPSSERKSDSVGVVCPTWLVVGFSVLVSMV